METNAKSGVIGAARWILIITAVTCALLELIDATIVNVALPEISGGIGATRTEIAWVVTSYALSNGIVIPLSGMLSNLFGRKVYFTGSVILFTISSMMCGMSTSLWMLTTWRFIQGAGGGGLLSTAQSIIVDAFPPEKINTANAIFGMGAISGPIIGPVLGGFIVQNLTWHWIFFVNLPIGAIAAVLSWLFVENLSGNVKPRKIDWWGILFIAVGIGALQYVLEEGGSHYWFESSTITVLFILSIIGLIAFIARELSIDYPAVNIRLFRNYNLSIGNLLMLITGAIMQASMFILPLFVRVSLGWTPMQTGYSLMFLAVGSGVGLMIASKILSIGVNRKAVMSFGVLMLSTFLMLLSYSSPDSGERDFIFPLILGGFGATFFMLPVMSLALEGLRGKDLAQGTGIANMLKRVGGAIGIAVLNIYLNHQNANVGRIMTDYINSYNPHSTGQISAFQHALISAGYATNEALHAAYKLMGNIVQQQQLLVSYDNGYRMVAVAILACIPLILLIKNSKKGFKNEAMH